MGDLTSRRWIVAKGIMFAVIVVMSGAGVLIHEGFWFRLGLLLICLWAACRFYYFLFYVLERYVGVEGLCVVARSGAPATPPVGRERPDSAISPRTAPR